MPLYFTVSNDTVPPWICQVLLIFCKDFHFEKLKMWAKGSSSCFSLVEAHGGFLAGACAEGIQKGQGVGKGLSLLT